MNNIKNKFSSEENTQEAPMENNQNINSINNKFSFNLSKNDLDVLFKYLSRSELKGIEVPEFNALLNLFKIKDV